MMMRSKRCHFYSLRQQTSREGVEIYVLMAPLTYPMLQTIKMLKNLTLLYHDEERRGGKKKLKRENIFHIFAVNERIIIWEIL